MWFHGFVTRCQGSKDHWPRTSTSQWRNQEISRVLPTDSKPLRMLIQKTNFTMMSNAKAGICATKNSPETLCQ